MMMHEEQIREALNKHWHASAAGGAKVEHDIYDEDAVCESRRHTSFLRPPFINFPNTHPVARPTRMLFGSQ
jgi:hypothetical protein